VKEHELKLIYQKAGSQSCSDVCRCSV